MDKLKLLCDWYTEDIVNKCYNTKANQYELAFLYPNDTACSGCSSSCTCGNHYKKHNNKLLCTCKHLKNYMNILKKKVKFKYK